MEGSGSNLSTSSSTSANTSSLSDTEDDQTIAKMLAADQPKLEKSNHFARRLSHLNSIPHTPRVIKDIPNPDDATFDHNRLAERLTTYGLAELQIEGDGNCQFRALADQLFHNPDYHRHIRKQVVKQLKNFRNLYESYVPMKYGDYLKKMKRSGEWGDHVTLQAAADRFGAKICLVTSFRDTYYIEILPYDKNFSKGGLSPARLGVVEARYEFNTHLLSLNHDELWLSFWSEVHYNSLYDSGDVPTRLPRKKRWLF